jgi:hypothetical protein
MSTPELLWMRCRLTTGYSPTLAPARGPTVSVEGKKGVSKRVLQNATLVMPKGSDRQGVRRSDRPYASTNLEHLANRPHRHCEVSNLWIVCVQSRTAELHLCLRPIKAQLCIPFDRVLVLSGVWAALPQ